MYDTLGPESMRRRMRERCVPSSPTTPRQHPVVQIRNFFKSDPYTEPPGIGNRAYRTTVITTHLGPTSTHTSTATATDHEPWDASVTPSSTAAPWTASTVATFPDRVRASAPLLAHSTCTARTRGAIEHAAAMSDGQIGPLLPCARKSRALASHAHGGCVRHARARVYRVGHAPPTPPACV